MQFLFVYALLHRMFALTNYETKIMNKEQTENSVIVPESIYPVNSYGFKTGWEQVPQGKAAEVRDKIMEAIGITAYPNFYKRLNGEVEPKVSEAKYIESIFKQYGITKIWGDGHDSQPDEKTTGSN